MVDQMNRSNGKIHTIFLIHNMKYSLYKTNDTPLWFHFFYFCFQNILCTELNVSFHFLFSLSQWCHSNGENTALVTHMHSWYLTKAIVFTGLSSQTHLNQGKNDLIIVFLQCYNAGNQDRTLHVYKITPEYCFLHVYKTDKLLVFFMVINHALSYTDVIRMF